MLSRLDRKGASAGRRRRAYLALALGTIVAGLAWHLGVRGAPPLLHDLLGDALWGMMMVWWMGVAAPRLPLRTRGLAAMAVCVAVELSQAYRTPLLDAIRATVPGHLVLGSGYDPRDFLAYAIGVAAAVLLARWAAE